MESKWTSKRRRKERSATDPLKGTSTYLLLGSTVDAKRNTETVVRTKLSGTGLRSTRDGVGEGLGLVGWRSGLRWDGNGEVGVL